MGTRENVSEGNTGDFRRQSGAGHARLGAAAGAVSPPRDPDIEGSRRHDGDESGRDDGRERPRPARVPHMDTASLRTADSTHGYLSRNRADRGTRAWDSPFVLYGTDVVHDRRHRARRRRPRARRLANPRSTARVAPRAVSQLASTFHTCARRSTHPVGYDSRKAIDYCRTGARRQSFRRHFI